MDYKPNGNVVAKKPTEITHVLDKDKGLQDEGLPTFQQHVLDKDKGLQDEGLPIFQQHVAYTFPTYSEKEDPNHIKIYAGLRSQLLKTMFPDQTIVITPEMTWGELLGPLQFTHVLDSDGLRHADPANPRKLTAIGCVIISKQVQTTWFENLFKLGHVPMNRQNAFMGYIIKLASNNGTVHVHNNELYEQIGANESQLLDWKKNDRPLNLNWSSETTIYNIDVLQRHQPLLRALSRENLHSFLTTGKWDITYKEAFGKLIEDTDTLNAIHKSISAGNNPFFKGIWPTILAKFYHWRAVDLASRWTRAIAGELHHTVYDPSVKFGYLYHTTRNVFETMTGKETRHVRPLLPVPPRDDATSATYERDVTVDDITDRVPTCHSPSFLFNHQRCNPYSQLSSDVAPQHIDDDPGYTTNGVCRRWRYIGRYPVLGPTGGSRLPRTPIRQLSTDSETKVRKHFGKNVDLTDLHSVIGKILDLYGNDEENQIRTIPSDEWDIVLIELGMTRDKLNPLDYIFIPGFPGSYWRPTYAPQGRIIGRDGKVYKCDMKWKTVENNHGVRKVMCPSTTETPILPYDTVIIVWDDSKSSLELTNELLEYLKTMQTSIVYHEVEPVAYIYVPDDNVTVVIEKLSKTFLDLTNDSPGDDTIRNEKCMRKHETVCFLYSDVKNITIRCELFRPIGGTFKRSTIPDSRSVVNENGSMQNTVTTAKTSRDENVQDLGLLLSKKLELQIPPTATVKEVVENDGHWTILIDTTIPNSVSDIIDTLPYAVDNVLGRDTVSTDETITVTSLQDPKQKLYVTFKNIPSPTGSPAQKATMCTNYYYDIPDMACNFACRYTDIKDSDLLRKVSLIGESLNNKTTMDILLSGGVLCVLFCALSALSKLGESIFNSLIDGLKDWINTWDFNPELISTIAETGSSGIVDDQNTGIWEALTNLCDRAAETAIDVSEELAQATAIGAIDGTLATADTMLDLANEGMARSLNMGFGFLADKIPAFDYQLGSMDELMEKYGSIEAAEDAVNSGAEHLRSAGEEFSDALTSVMSVTGPLYATYKVRKWVKQQIIRAERDMYEKLSMWQETHSRHVFDNKVILENVDKYHTNQFDGFNKALLGSSKIPLDYVYNPRFRCRPHNIMCFRCRFLKIEKNTAVRYVNDTLRNAILSGPSVKL
jgi:hypothetical protein